MSMGICSGGIVPDDRSAVLVPDVSDHIQVRGPEFKLPLPIDDCGQRCTDQERPLRMALNYKNYTPQSNYTFYRKLHVKLKLCVYFAPSVFRKLHANQIANKCMNPVSSRYHDS